jgi:hypothetical protein
MPHHNVRRGFGLHLKSKLPVERQRSGIPFENLEPERTSPNEVTGDNASETSIAPSFRELNFIQPPAIAPLFEGNQSSRNASHQDHTGYSGIPSFGEQLALKILVPRTELALNDVAVCFAFECVSPFAIVLRAASQFVAHFFNRTVLFGCTGVIHPREENPGPESWQGATGPRPYHPDRSRRAIES